MEQTSQNIPSQPTRLHRYKFMLNFSSSVCKEAGRLMYQSRSVSETQRVAVVLYHCISLFSQFLFMWAGEARELVQVTEQLPTSPHLLTHQFPLLFSQKKKNPERHSPATNRWNGAKMISSKTRSRSSHTPFCFLFLTKLKFPFLRKEEMAKLQTYCLLALSFWNFGSLS